MSELSAKAKATDFPESVKEERKKKIYIENHMLYEII